MTEMKVATPAAQPQRETSRTVADEAPSTQIAATSEERIRERAYRCWEQAGCPAGDGIEFWLKAETDLALEIQTPGTNDESRRAGK
ncbi:MAG: DUF2934 domain-containing protein [Planctomycetaceae bacterium]